MPRSTKDQIQDMLDIGKSSGEEESTEEVETETSETKETEETKESETETETETDTKESSEETKETEDETKETETETETEEKVEKEVETETETEETPSELDLLKEENDKLRKQVDDAHGRDKSETTETETETKTETKEVETDKPIEDVDFLGEDADLDDITRNVATFNKVLNKVYKAGVESQRGFQEDTLRSIPNIVKSNVIIQATLKKKVDVFYSGNKDLLPFKKAVGTVYEELASENPEWNLDKVFNETEKEARIRLELPKKDPTTKETETEDTTTETRKKPKFAKTKGVKTKPKPKLDASGLLGEIDEMNQNS